MPSDQQIGCYQTHLQFHILWVQLCQGPERNLNNETSQRQLPVLQLLARNLRHDLPNLGASPPILPDGERRSFLAIHFYNHGTHPNRFEKVIRYRLKNESHLVTFESDNLLPSMHPQVHPFSQRCPSWYQTIQYPHQQRVLDQTLWFWCVQNLAW